MGFDVKSVDLALIPDGIWCKMVNVELLSNKIWCQDGSFRYD